MNGRIAFYIAMILTIAGIRPVGAAETLAATPLNLKVPPGFTIELVAGSPLTERPIVASFDDAGRLYVAESSGSNDPVEQQLAERPHRVARLEDTDGDGKFDRRTVFADRMMFPEGVQCLDGSVYVSAPPSIWKLTDTNEDGVADERVEWFQGKTLTGCANDLHGPYLGLDGWLYWCKGAFAEQTHVVHGREWKTRAAHIFRSRTDGSGIEPVMTGGMDNPVDVVFTPEGERILSATLVVGNGRRDGILHAIYGGVYGKEHGVLDGHPRTGELMPVFALMSPTAPCGLERYDSTVFGHEFRDNLFASQFNTRSVTRHVLRPEGSTFVTENSDFVTCDNVDFHPTDVLMDADGSLLVIDTGGWYKLCCPTSQLWKPDILGGIYRVRRTDAVVSSDPRGLKIAWEFSTPFQLWALLCDSRPAVRQRASREFVRRGDSSDIKKFVSNVARRNPASTISILPSGSKAGYCDSRTASLARLWVLSQMGGDGRSCIRQLLKHDDPSVRLAALHAVSLHRDVEAYSQVLALLANDVPANRRAAAEVIGRLEDSGAVPFLLKAAANNNDRVLQHSITFALIELADAGATRAGLLSKSPGTQSAALVALDQMPGGQIESQHVIPLLNSSDETLRNTARWLVSRHAEWGGALGEWLRAQLAELPLEPIATNESTANKDLEDLLVGFAVDPAIRELLANVLTDHDASTTAQQVSLRVMARAKPSETPAKWRDALAAVVSQDDAELVRLAIAAARALPKIAEPDERLNQALLAIGNSPSVAVEERASAFAVVAASMRDITDPQFELLTGLLAADQPVSVRSAAVDALSVAPLTETQLNGLCAATGAAGPLELNRLLEAFSKAATEELGLKLLSSLKSSSSLPSLRIDVLRTSLTKYGPRVQQGIDELESQLNVDAASQRERIEGLLPLVAEGDVRRGHAVFYSTKAACSACHQLGYAGGLVGPELSHIGEIRTERDLLESILYPSKSLVRSYEPVQVVTVDGRTLNGTIRNETETEFVLATGPDQEVRLPRAEVEVIEPSLVSVMPGGLDGQLTAQELADLVAFLKNATKN